MSVLRQQRRVSAKRPAKSETTLWNVYIQISSTPHTSHRALSTYKAIHLQSSRWEVSSVFTVCLSDLWEGKKTKKTRGFIEAQCGPLVIGRGSAEALQRFSCSAVLSFCSHTVWAFTVESAADLRKILHTEVASKSCRVLFREADGLPC